MAMQGYLVEALKERMAYLRKPDGQKRGKENSIHTPPSKSACPKMPASPCVVLVNSEDRAAHDRHVKALQRECRGFRQNKQVTKVL